MLYLETKWASLVPFGVTVELLRDVLPVGTTLNVQTVCNHLRRVATRMEESLAGPSRRLDAGSTSRQSCGKFGAVEVAELLRTTHHWANTLKGACRQETAP